MAISLTKFIDFVNKSGHPKFTVVQNNKTDSYEVYKDFYKKFREAVIKVHKKDLTIDYLEKVFRSLTDNRKTKHYALLNKGYKKWLRGKNIEWFTPPSSIYNVSGLEIAVNPELGLIINNVPHIIKMHLKKNPLTKSNADIIITLMDIACNEEVPENSIMAVMDVRKGKIYKHSGKNTDELLLQLEAEADYWQKLSDGL